MKNFSTKQLPVAPDAIAPDGSEVRTLLSLAGGSMAHFQLNPGETSTAVIHRSVEEIWFVIAGGGQMWREQEGSAEIVDLHPGVCLSIPVGTRFQFPCTSQQALAAVAVTMPPWPGNKEAVEVPGAWPSTKHTDR
jgi:mannose-6-phosphate isomerase-like protein (cupin superfamily)